MGKFATPRQSSPILLFIHSFSCGNELEIVGEELSEFAEFLLAKPSCHVFHTSETETISIPPVISKMTGLYSSNTES